MLPPAAGGALTSAEQAAQIVQVLSHILLDLMRRRIRFQVGEAVEADVFDSLEDGRKFDFAVTQIVGIIFQVKLADPVFSQPANLLHHIKTALRAIPYIIL